MHSWDQHGKPIRAAWNNPSKESRSILAGSNPPKWQAQDLAKLVPSVSQRKPPNPEEPGIQAKNQKPIDATPEHETLAGHTYPRRESGPQSRARALEAPTSKGKNREKERKNTENRRKQEKNKNQT